MDSITGRVTRSARRLSVEKTDKEDDLRSAASTPTKKRPTKRLSTKPDLEDVMETDAACSQEGDSKLSQIMEETPIPDLLIKEFKKNDSIYSGTPAKDSPSHSLRKRTASTCSPESLKKSPQAKSPPASEIVNTKTPKKTMLKKIENSLLQTFVDSPKPRKKRNSIGGSDADAAQELTPLRRSRRLSTELNVVVEDPLREEQSDHVQVPITRRGKRLSVVPLQPSLPEENEDQKEIDSTSSSPMASLNVSSPKSKSSKIPKALSPSKASSTPASPILLEDPLLTRRDRKSKSPTITITVTSPLPSLNISSRSEKSPKTPKPQTPNKIDSTSASPLSQDISLTRNDRKSRTPTMLSLNKSEIISESASPKSTQNVSSTITLTPNKSFKQTLNSSNSDDSLLKNVSSPSSGSMTNTSTEKLDKSCLRKSMNEVKSPTKGILDNVTNGVTEPAEANNTCSLGNTEVCNLSQNSIRRSPRKNKSIQNMSIDEGVPKSDTEALSGDSKLNASYNTSISAVKHNLSTQSLVSLNQTNVDMDGNKSISSKKSNESFKLKFSDNEDNDVEKVVQYASMNASVIESKANNSVTSSTMHIVYNSPLKTNSPNTSVKSNKKNRKSSSNIDGNNDVANITDINYEESIATSTPFVKSNMDKSRTPSSIKNTSATNKSPKIESTYETPKRDTTNSFTNKSETDKAMETSSDEEDEDAMQIVFLDSQASDAGSNYQSGDSMDGSQREEIEANEIVEKGESLNSESGESDNDSYEKDSFICSDEEESIASISSDKDTSRQFNDKSSKFSKSRESIIWKDEVNVLSNSQPGLSGCTLSSTKPANASFNEEKRSFIGSNNVSNESLNTSKRESTTLISTSTKSRSNLSMKMETPNKSSSNLSMKTETPNKSSSNLSMKTEMPNKSSSNLSMKTETPNKSSSNLSMKTETPNKSSPNLSMKTDMPNKSSSSLFMKMETPNKSLLKENNSAQSPKRLSIVDLNNTAKSIADFESDVLSLSTISVNGITPSELLANLAAGSMSTPNTGKLSKTTNSDVSLSGSTKKRLSLDKSNNASKANDSIKEDNVLSTSRGNSSGFYESNSSISKLISDASGLKKIKTLITSNKRISLNSSNISKSNESLEISKSPANASTFNTTGFTPKQTKSPANASTFNTTGLTPKQTKSPANASTFNTTGLTPKQTKSPANASTFNTTGFTPKQTKSPANASTFNTTGLTPKQTKSPANASTFNTTGLTPKQTKNNSLDASLSTSFGQKDQNKSITKLLNGSGSTKILIQEKTEASPKPTRSSMKVDSSDDCKTLNENSSAKKSLTDVSSMEKRKSQPMGEHNSNILQSKQPETKFKAAASTEFEVEPLNLENIVIGTKRKLEADSLWTCTAGDFQVVKKPKQQPTRSITASDYGSTTSFKIVPLKKTPKAFLLVDTNLESNVVNFKQDMLYGKRCPRKDSSKLLKMQQKLKAAKNRGPF